MILSTGVWLGMAGTLSTSTFFPLECARDCHPLRFFKTRCAPRDKPGFGPIAPYKYRYGTFSVVGLELGYPLEDWNLYIGLP